MTYPHCLVLDVSCATRHIKCDNTYSFDQMDRKSQVVCGKNSPTWVNVPVDTFHVRHVANALSCLAGHRPVPANRKCLWGMNERIKSIASRCLVEITRGLVTTKKGELKPVVSFRRSQKTQMNSFRNTTRPITLNGELKLCSIPNDISWDSLRFFMGGLSYDAFGEFCDEVLGPGVFGVIGFVAVLERLNAIKDTIAEHPIWTATYQENENSSPKPVLQKKFRSIIIDGKVDGEYFLRSFSREKMGVGHALLKVLNYGVSDVSTVSGRIYVPVTADECNMFRNGSGFASILEGGIVKLTRVVPMTDMLVALAKPVSGELQ